MSLHVLPILLLVVSVAVLLTSRHSFRIWSGSQNRRPSGASNSERGREAESEMPRQWLSSTYHPMDEGQEGTEIQWKYQNHICRWKGLSGGQSSVKD